MPKPLPLSTFMTHYLSLSHHITSHHITTYIASPHVLSVCRFTSRPLMTTSLHPHTHQFRTYTHLSHSYVLCLSLESRVPYIHSPHPIPSIPSILTSRISPPTSHTLIVSYSNHLPLFCVLLFIASRSCVSIVNVRLFFSFESVRVLSRSFPSPSPPYRLSEFRRALSFLDLCID